MLKEYTGTVCIHTSINPNLCPLFKEEELNKASV
jgi:hypothetical protein